MSVCVCVSCLSPLSLQHKTGLPISTYFSAVKLRWLLDNVAEVRQAVLSGRAMFGTVDSWIIWVSVTHLPEFIFATWVERLFWRESDLYSPSA